MKKVYQDCLTRKKRIIEEIKQKETLELDQLAAYAYQLEVLLDEMKEIPIETVVRSRKKEALFYEEEVTDVLTYYWYMRELSLVLCTLPFREKQHEGHLDSVALYYTSFKSDYFRLYACYCAKAYQFKSEEIRTYLKFQRERPNWLFFDKEALFLYPVYFRVVELVLLQLNRWETTANPQPIKPMLVWEATKIELVLVVFALYKYTQKKQDKPTVREWARTFEQVFGVSISKNFYQILNEYKKKKNIEDNLFLKMNEILLEKFQEH
ncbi:MULTISPECIES: RteC domain-containing protein [unclassified Myroides]|uniref:RteC domain-containing protein n=1 Tax=unclassified Myroides TaxID=2642485 RepID=UPI003D2F8BB0